MMFLTILTRGFQIMAAGIILALSGGALILLLLLLWAMLLPVHPDGHLLSPH